MTRGLLLTATLMTLLTGCADIDVPSNIGVHGNTTVTVRHEVAVTVELQTAFEAQCAGELPETATPQEIIDCRDAKIAEYVTAFLAAVSQLGEQQQQQTGGQ